MANIYEDDRNEELQEAPASEDGMVRTMRSYRRLKSDLDARRERGKAYLEQVKAEIEMDLRPIEEAVENLKGSMEIYVKDHNGGTKFAVPGLGTAFVQKRKTPKVVDEEPFRLHIRNTDPARYPAVFVAQPDKLNKKEADKLIKSALEDGELLPGVEMEETETLAVRLTGGRG